MRMTGEDRPPGGQVPPLHLPVPQSRVGQVDQVGVGAPRRERSAVPDVAELGHDAAVPGHQCSGLVRCRASDVIGSW